MLSALGRLDLGVVLDPRSLSVVLILFLIDFYGSVAKFIGLTRNTNLVQGGELPRLRESLVVDGAASVLGAALGTSTVLVYVESGVGIAAGGRTGLTAVTCGVLMLACFLIAPLLQFVPVVATSGALFFVAWKLFPGLGEIRTYTRTDRIVLVVMQLVVVASFAIDRAMLVGLLAYLGADVAVGRKPDPYLVLSTSLLASGAVLQHVS
jgi:AGZA family xanthine/uracil permease-like MFS transporter